MASFRPSVNAREGWWQVAQLYLPVTDSAGSKKRRRPNATLAFDMRLSAGTAGAGKPRGSDHKKPSIAGRLRGGSFWRRGASRTSHRQ